MFFLQKIEYTFFKTDRLSWRKFKHIRSKTVQKFCWKCMMQQKYDTFWKSKFLQKLHFYEVMLRWKALKYCMSKKRDFQDLPRWCLKTQLKIVAGFGFKQYWDLSDVQYYCRILFPYKKISWEFGVRSATIHVIRTAAFSKSAKNFAKWYKKNRFWVMLSETICYFVLVQFQKTISETNFMRINFIRLRRLDTEIFSGWNNGLHSYYMEFTVEKFYFEPTLINRREVLR